MYSINNISFLKEDRRSYRCNFCSCKKKAWKNSGLYGIWTLDLCDTGAALYQLSLWANWEQVVELVCYKPISIVYIINNVIIKLKLKD